MTTYVALLRGINVGGNNPIKMTDLEAGLGALGYRNVRTYLTTGNAIFSTAPTDARTLETEIEAAIAHTFSTPVRVLVRNLEQMKALLEAIDELWKPEPNERQNVIFLAPEIDRKQVLDGLQPKPAIEAVHYRPGALLWAAKRRYLTRSTMLKLNKMSIYQGMTVRSPSTTRRIYELMREVDAT